MDLVSRRSALVRGTLFLLLGVGASAQVGKQATRPLPPFVEMMPGATQVTSSAFSNDLRHGGTVLAQVEQPAAAILTFYKASMARNGLTPGQETTTPKGVVLVKALSADGKRELRLEVNPSKTARVMFQLNYVVNK
jgi:hypothetical protein